MDLGDINVKKFGKDGDYLIKVEQKSLKMIIILYLKLKKIYQTT